jgi:hypothetical protein
MKKIISASVTGGEYQNNRFYIYKATPDHEHFENEAEAASVEVVFSKYPSVFTNVEIISPPTDEPELLDPSDKDVNNVPTFDVENVESACPGIIDELSELDFRVVGLDQAYVRRKIDSSSRNVM